MPWPVAPIVTAASPVVTAARAAQGPTGRGATHPVDRIDDRQRRAHSPLGIILVGERARPRRPSPRRR